jgi:hypothetical protein
MQYTQDIEIHYPTTVIQRQFTGMDWNSELFALLNSLSERFANTPQNAVKSGLISTVVVIRPRPA